MKTFKLIPASIGVLTCLIAIQAGAQSISVYPAGVIAPRGSYQVISAQITGIDNKTVTWRTTGGTLVGTNPCLSANAAPCTIALYSTTPGTYTVTASSNANSSITATSTVTITASPTAITTHPREWMTQATLSALQAKAVSGNDVWSVLQTPIANAVAGGNAGWLVANGGGGWTCQGGTGVPSAAYVTTDESGGGPENFVGAALLAYAANIDPNSTNRANYACYAHDMYLYYMKEILKTACGYGMCNAGTISGNSGGDWGIGIGTTLDWIYSSFSSSEKATILAAHKKAAQMIVTQIVISSGHPDPVGAYNSPALATDYSGVRTTGNNYYATHMAQLAAMAVAWDAADDPTTTSCSGGRNQVCTDGSANSMHAYLYDAVGAYLYSLWLNFDDPSVTTSAYNAQFGSSISSSFTCSQEYDTTLELPCYGNARGGISHEGVMYMGSMGRLREMFNLMHTAGLDDPMILGPQLSFATSSWWDLDVQGMLHSMAPAVYSGHGSTFQPLFGYNEINSIYDPVMYNGQTFGDLLWYDQMTGRTDRSNSLGWIVANLTSPQEPYSNSASQNIWFGMSGYLYLPAGSSTYAALGATDPRPSMPMDYYSLNAGNLIAGTGWNSSDAVFGTLNPIYPTQDHEMGPAGRFFFYRNGDWATKGLDGYCDYDNSGTFSECNASYSNTAAYQNSPGIALSGYYLVDAFVTQGGEANHGFGTNATATLQSFMPGYVAQSVNATGAYNFNYPSAYARSDVKNATRDFLWIKPYYVAIYDRGVTGQSAFKQVWFNATGTPAISGTNTSWTSALGTLSVYLHTLLPSGASISNQPFASNIGNQAYGDYAPQTRIGISAGTPTSTQFLNVIEAQNHGAAATGATLVQSTAGQGFDGALIGSSLAMFMRTWPATFTGVTYPASGATTQYISDLTPNTTYTIAGAGAPANATTDTAGVLTFSAAGTGNITVGSSNAPSLQSIAVTPSTGVLQALGSQQYTATCSYSDGTNADCTSSVAWSSSTMAVVTVNSSGIATGVAQGSASILATSGSVQGKSTVSVPAASLQTITVTPGSLAVTMGSAQQFQATGTYSDSSTTDVTSQVTWSSSNPAVASANSTGLASTMSQGNATIIAASGNIKGQASITVSAAAAAPSFSPAAGTYTSAQTVSITTTTPSATIYYTTNGSAPTTSSPVYSGPISVAATETIKAIAVATGGSASPAGSASYTITQAATTPTFSPAAGTYTSAQTVSISTTTPSSTIYYTTNGSTPTTSSPVYSAPISVAATETIEAIAVTTGGSASPASSAVYTITPPANAPTFSPEAGTYTSAETVTISTTTPSATIYYTTNGSTPTTNSPIYSGPVSVAASETIKAIAVATGGSASPASSAAYTITLPAGTPSFSPAAGTFTSAQTVSITTTTPSSTIYYTTNGSAPTTSSPVYSGPISVSATETIKAIAAATAGSASPAASALYTITLPATTPTFSPEAGTYTSAQTVSITTTTPSATIYYTTNGSAPTTSSSVYAGPISVSATETIKAIAIATGGSASPAGSASYTITLPATTPSFSPAAGTYSSAQTISITTTTPSATIYYTTNGSTPTTSSSAYSGPISVAATETVKAIAVATGGSASPAGSASYTITLPATTPSFSPAAGTYTSAQTVSITTTTPSATIYYTTNGSAPTTSSSVYSGPISVAATETIKAIAAATGGSTSPASSASYAITPPAAMPTFSVAPGTYTAPQTVNITSSAPSATIYYTTNGATPTSSSPICSGPIMVATTQTVKAVAVANGYAPSQVNAASYTIAAPPVTTTFSPAAGTYTSTQTVSILTTAPSATIYYTTDGSDPTKRSSVYSYPIMINATETIKAITVVNGQSANGEVTATYTVSLPQVGAPAFSPAGGTYSSPQWVTISTASPSTVIYYTTNGRTPTTSSPIYAGPIMVSATETVKAIAVSLNPVSSKPVGRNSASRSISPVGSADYTMNSGKPGFRVSLTPASFTVTQGQAGTAAVLITPLNGYSSAVSFSCSGLPQGASCQFSPSSVTPAGDVATTTLTVATSQENTAPVNNSSPTIPGSAMAMALCCLGWKRRRGVRLLMFAALAGVGISVCTGCGANLLPPASSTSTVTLIATDGNIQPSASFTLTLQ